MASVRRRQPLVGGSIAARAAATRARVRVRAPALASDPLEIDKLLDWAGPATQNRAPQAQNTFALIPLARLRPCWRANSASSRSMWSLRAISKLQDTADALAHA